MARSHLADMQSADTEPSELRRADSGVLTGDFLNTEDSTLHCRDVWWKKKEKSSVGYHSLKAVEVSQREAEDMASAEKEKTLRDLKLFQNSTAV